jgi:hypothetical protein
MIGLLLGVHHSLAELVDKHEAEESLISGT